MTDWLLAVIWIIGILAYFFLMVMVMDGNRFKVVSYEINSEKVGKDYRFVLLADLHNKSYGKDNYRLIAKINELKPDAVFIAGDLLTAKPDLSYDAAISLAVRLGKEYPVFYGMGNHETRLFLYPDLYGDMGASYVEALKAGNIRLMRNESEQFDSRIQVTGLEIERSYYKRFTPKPMEEDYLEKTLGAADPAKFQILIAHNPDYFPDYVRWGADLVLSGHIHGGVIRLPVLGGVASPAVRLFPKYDGGIYREGKAAMILSRGLGMHTIPVRIFNPGELVCFTVRTKEAAWQRNER